MLACPPERSSTLEADQPCRDVVLRLTDQSAATASKAISDILIWEPDSVT
jgi:hypothetical protein